MRYANHFYVANFLPSRRRDCLTSALCPTPTLPKPHYPLLCTITLASLVKGRWIDGKAQALILLLSACDMPTIFMLQTFLPSRRRDCLTSALCPTPTLPKPHYPLLCTITLASPRKRGGGTAVEVFRLAVQYSDSPAFTILKLFRAVTVGIVNALEAFMIALLSISISYAPSSLSKTTLSLALHHHPCLPCQREVD